MPLLRLACLDLDGTLLRRLGPSAHLAAFEAALDDLVGAATGIHATLTAGALHIAGHQIDGSIDAEIAAWYLDEVGVDHGELGRYSAAVAAQYARLRALAPGADVESQPGVRAGLARLATRFMTTPLSGNHHAIGWEKLATAGLDDLLARPGLWGGWPATSRADLLGAALVRYGAAPDNCWYVGDTVRDVAAARAAGVHVVVVATGAFPIEALQVAAPDAAVSTFTEAVEYLLHV